jgi:hypothetical protein
MPFEARQLRVQLPCGPVTVMEAEASEAQMAARRVTGWGALLGARLSDPSCGPGTSCGFHSGFDIGDLCLGSDPIDVNVVVDAHVLPVLRAQLEARLKELGEAEKAVAQKLNTRGKG